MWGDAPDPALATPGCVSWETWAILCDLSLSSQANGERKRPMSQLVMRVTYTSVWEASHHCQAPGEWGTHPLSKTMIFPFGATNH